MDNSSCKYFLKWLKGEFQREDWRATSEVESNPELTKALLSKEDPSEYVGIKPPHPDAQLIHVNEIQENEKIAGRLKDVWANQQSGAEGIE